MAEAVDPLTSLENRLTALESKVESLKPKKKDAWDKAQTLSSFMTPLLTAAIGTWLIGLVNVGLQRQQLQVTSVKEMQGLLTELRNPQITPDKAEAAAYALAAFGQAAVTPLLNEIQTGQPTLVIAGETGLRAVGMTDPKPTCQRLTEVVRNRSQLYIWITHRSNIQLLGDLECRDAGAVSSRSTSDCSRRALPRRD